jgi:thiol-disulfide isomerase/thioredoxin
MLRILLQRGITTAAVSRRLDAMVDQTLRISIDRGDHGLHSTDVIPTTAPEDRGDVISSRPRVSAYRGREGPSAAPHHVGARPAPRRNFLVVSMWTAAVLASAALSAATVGETRFVPWSGAAPKSIVLDDLSGNQIGLDALRGRVVLVHFFATWCEPCQAELTALQAFAARHEQHALSVVAIDVGEADMRVRRLVATIGFDRPVLLDRDRAVAKAWGVSALPTTVVLDNDSTPCLVAEGDLDWSSDAATAPVSALMSDKPRNGSADRNAGAADDEPNTVTEKSP